MRRLSDVIFIPEPRVTQTFSPDLFEGRYFEVLLCAHADLVTTVKLKGYTIMPSFRILGHV